MLGTTDNFRLEVTTVQFFFHFLCYGDIGITVQIHPRQKSWANPRNPSLILEIPWSAKGLIFPLKEKMRVICTKKYCSGSMYLGCGLCRIQWVYFVNKKTHCKESLSVCRICLME